MTPFTHLISVAVPIPGPNMDTDQIIPARYLSRARDVGFADGLFRDLRYAEDGAEKPGFILNREPYRNGKIVVGERNFACGSSREHAVWALLDYGVRAVLAPSFGDIFYTNSLKNGLLPIRLPGAVIGTLLERLLREAGDIDIDLPSQQARLPDGSVHDFDIDPYSKHCLLNGLDDIDYTLSQLGPIEAFEQRYGRENS
ncbi:MAG TPA: 3-isopropylmalate dehydratase small subunit [Acidocella sp.]|jgi:3-isopropylmalate/(R)-2-methylmalate dehydratase small subunit|uniref:3-isopropylmalate dehydratase small subunit n=1 Tax=Acidocella sp. TaxID=50710 RepID=UPI002C6A13AA|nr:3-isopropylmalate dehydratase small subunit [Acidocella sp.]HVE23124.1 3-isopropylmalate dehydratase small subunit [Acidocella sp.]